MSETFTHRPVLLDECIEALNIRPDGIYLDGTLGRAGHSREIARRLTTGRLICVDRDQAALDAAQDRLKDWMDRVTLVHSNFDQLDAILDGLGLAGVDGMLFDLGVSSPQLDDGSRGFSYMADAPLDMRMDRSEGLTAADVVNQWPQEELRRILSQYGEERYAPSIAAAIVRRRQDKPIETTLELVDIIKSAMPARALKEKQHPAKRSFQAIRIATRRSVMLRRTQHKYRIFEDTRHNGKRPNRSCCLCSVSSVKCPAPKTETEFRASVLLPSAHCCFADTAPAQIL